MERKKLANIGKISQFGSCSAIPMKNIIPSPFQVRADYGDVKGLAHDIEEKGLLQPILVRPISEGTYEIVHGHRRHKAIELLGRSYIDAFCRKLTDSEAITIQGSENIWRKDYTPIEEAKLYFNYKTFLEKENDKRISYKQIAEAFKVSEDMVQRKIDLLELPQEIQDKLQKGEIPYTKARALTILVKESRTPTGGRENEPVPRTKRFYSEINRLSEEIEKSSLGGLRTEKFLAQAAENIRDGISYDEAIQKAKINEAVEHAQEQLKKGTNPEEILKNIFSHQSDPSEILEATREANLGLLKKLLTEKLILCPHCGKSDLVWDCNGKSVVEDK
jgi:ParB/RepB/Spo0J family partition protein